MLRQDIIDSLHRPNSDMTERLIVQLSPADTTDEYWRRLAGFTPSKKHADDSSAPAVPGGDGTRRARLDAVKRESRLNLLELIRRWHARAMAQRTHFLRTRVGPRTTAL